MKAKEFVPASKPRNFVAKNQKTAGAGAHKDKKRAEKQGDVKHKKKHQDVSEGGIDTGNMPMVRLGSTVTARPAVKIGSLVKAQGLDGVWRVDSIRGENAFITMERPNTGISKNIPVSALRVWTNKPIVSLKNDSMSERVRDPEDWDEGDTEPPNNFAVYINGKKWKVFKGRGQFADDYKEMQHFRQLQNWAQQKSSQTGKKWEVYKTGEQATESVEEGWKEKLGAAALAGSLAFGAAGANARVLPGADPSINRFTGKPIATQQDTQQDRAGDAEKDSGQQKIGFSTEYLKKVADGKHPRPMISVDDAKKELERRGEL
jgi:hypothetical protein